MLLDVARKKHNKADPFVVGLCATNHTVGCVNNDVHCMCKMNNGCTVHQDNVLMDGTQKNNDGMSAFLVGSHTTHCNVGHVNSDVHCECKVKNVHWPMVGGEDKSSATTTETTTGGSCGQILTSK